MEKKKGKGCCGSKKGSRIQGLQKENVALRDSSSRAQVLVMLELGVGVGSGGGIGGCELFHIEPPRIKTREKGKGRV
ncbi:hypothetical protein M0804_010952 [Polistes exclamans]|nr:hypothetical protein M0804_010952 [Polistes exclamans]